MTIPFTCPHCGHQTAVAQQYAGQSGPCAGCGKQVTIPAVASASPPPPETGAPRADTRSLLLLATLAAATLCGMILIGAILLVFLAPSNRPNQGAGSLSPCESNLQRIGAAMQRYHEANGCFPPAYVADQNGKPMHSWRVLLLPYLGHEALFRSYNMTQPWDSPQNLWLAQRMPDVYGCPNDPDVAYGETSYMVINGPGALFEADKKTRTQDVVDGLSKTILVIESVGSGTSWTAPVDLNFQEMPFAVNAGRKGGIRSVHASGDATVVMGDGVIYSLPDHLSPDTIRALVTINGGETVRPGEFDKN